MTQRKGRRQLGLRGARSKHSTQKRQHEAAADAQLDAVSKLRHSADSSSRLEAGWQDSCTRSAEWLDFDTVSRQSQDRDQRTSTYPKPRFSFLHACMQCMHYLDMPTSCLYLKLYIVKALRHIYVIIGDRWRLVFLST